MTELYKKDSKGKIRVWKIYTEGADVVQVSGLIDGKHVENRAAAKPKNVGKSNETTAEEQAMKEAEAKVVDQLTTGYFRTVEEAKTIECILPMLAKEYGKEFKKINWSGNVYTQPKLDGMRCLAIIKADGSVTLISRKGKFIDTVPHIEKTMSTMNLGVDIILDGELYAHGLSFQGNMKLIKKYRKGESERISYNIYDVISDRPYKERNELLKDLWMKYPIFDLVETTKISSFEDLKLEHSKNISEGYEGTIVRHGSAPYKIDARSSNLLKYKDFIDITAEVIDVIPMDKRPEQGKLVCVLSEGVNIGKEFDSNLKMSWAEREEILRNKENYIGLTAEIRFFDYTDEGKPRFPVAVGFRLDK